MKRLHSRRSRIKDSPQTSRTLEWLEPRLPLTTGGVAAEPAPDVYPVVDQLLVAEPPSDTLEIVFSKPMQIDEMIEDQSILSAVNLVHYRSGPVRLTARQFHYSEATQSLIWSSASALPPGSFELQLNGAELLDTDGNALVGGSEGLSFHLPTFAGETLIESAGAVIEAGEYSVPSLADWNLDGWQDLIVGEKSPSGGKVRVYLNSGTDELPVYDSFSYAQYAGSDLTVPCSGCLGIFPRVADWNQDGRQDLMLGLADGRIQVYPNTDDGPEPVLGIPYELQVGQPGAETTLTVGARRHPAGGGLEQ